ncbi:hypothetical protein SAY87_024766 [Trapa incisa]|uniref:Uncharacterized protein n=1 Tax=Trapa incisa TaxID=236973 RepID=A0AAN7GCJ6_9MYRT|nr:hypothetical protein SAY87_024766 [Trapa incisa]
MPEYHLPANGRLHSPFPQNRKNYVLCMVKCTSDEPKAMDIDLLEEEEEDDNISIPESWIQEMMMSLEKCLLPAPPNDMYELQADASCIMECKKTQKLGSMDVFLPIDEKKDIVEDDSRLQNAPHPPACSVLTVKSEKKAKGLKQEAPCKIKEEMVSAGFSSTSIPKSRLAVTASVVNTLNTLY